MTANTIKVIIADDHSVFLDGLQMLVESDPALEMVERAENGKDLIHKAGALQPDVVITDLKMPGINGIEAIKKINENKSTPCIALSTFDNDALILDAMAAGAKGYILKNAQKEEIIDGIKTVSKFQHYYCKATEAKMLQIIAKTRIAETGKGTSLFSEREIELIQYICDDVSSEEIGKKLFVSKRTVDGLRAKLLNKMDAKSSVGIVLYAIKNNLITIEDKKEDT